MSSMQSWSRKFAVAVAGMCWSFRNENSYCVHLPVAAAVIVLAAWLRIEAWRWTAVLLAIGIVLAAELLNGSLEQLVKALHPDHDPRVGRALDVAAAAVLVVALTAILVGLIALGPPLWQAIGSPRPVTWFDR
jgi:diacylglycerol kinase